ncbi:MAG: tagaturonate reductase, partial [Synergistetes bacterium]|nr:tagaturonate reductase [Synergistota bacterium]
MITVLQFGEGNFIRAFFDWMLQKINERTGAENEVFLVQPIPEGRLENILKAGGKYHVLLRGYENGKYKEVLDRVEVIKDGVNPFKDYSK